MSSPHPSERDVVDYLAGALASDLAATLEQHVEVCSGCATRLQQEAALELALFETADAFAEPICRPTPTPRPWLAPVLAGLAMAAAVLLAWSDTAALVRIDSLHPVFASVATEFEAAEACLPQSGEQGCQTAGSPALFALATFPPEGVTAIEDIDPGELNACLVDDGGDDLVCLSGESQAG